MHHTISNSSTQSNQKNLKECPKFSTRESRQERVPTPMHRSQSHGTRKLITITCIKRVPTPMHRSQSHGTHKLITITHIKCSQIIKDSIRQQKLKGKTQFIKKIERGKTPYDSSIATKPVFTSRLFHLKNTRERYNT